MARNIKEDLAKARLDADDKMRTIDFQVDTLSNKTTAGGYFTPDERTVTINYQEGNEEFNDWSQSPTVLIHEQKHRDNYSQGIYEYVLSSEQAYKVNMHDEISANMASLLYLRDEYLKTGNMAVFEQENGRFAFYTDAIKKGEINPFSSKEEDFDKEMALIVNGTRDMWVRDFASTDSYLSTGKWYAQHRGEADGKHAAFYDENYDRAKKIMYTIGGVDFTKYMDNDVDIPSDGKRKIYKGVKLAKELGLPDYDDKMSLLQYQNLLQHALVAQDKRAGMKSDEQIMPGEDRTAGQWNTDMAAYVYLTDKKLTDYQQEEYNNALKRVAQENKPLIDGIINNIADEYYAKGKSFPKGDDKAYNEAVNKLYSGQVKFNQDDLKFEGEVNLRKAFNPNDELPLKELPEFAKQKEQELENMGAWNRSLKQYAHFFGFDYTDDKIASWPAVARYPVSALGGYIGIPVLAAAEKCKEWGSSAFNTVKGWFGDDDKKENKDNAPVHPVDKDKEPQYKEWSAEQRVSEVQKVKMLDLTADVIRKPSGNGKPDEFMARKKRDGLKTDMQKAAQEKAKMVQVIEGMNRINGNKNTLEPNVMVNALYDKFGDKAYDLLNKAVNEPYNFAQNIGDSSIKTSRQAVVALCNIDEAQKQAVINAVFDAKSR